MLAGDDHGREQPVATRDLLAGDPAEAVDRAASLTLGFLVVLDTLPPEDRAVFLLADVFAVPFADIATIVGRSPEACRQAASRARRRIRDGGTTGPSRPDHLGLGSGGAPGHRGGQRRPRRHPPPRSPPTSPSSATVARPATPPAGRSSAPRRWPGSSSTSPLDGPRARPIELAEINSSPALISRPPGEAPIVWSIECGPDDRVTACRMMLAPEKLVALDAEALQW